jgi:hypothetical protein
MIIGKDFVWLHLGKTGGKTSREAISLLELDGKTQLIKIFNYPDHHFSIRQYEEKYNEKISDRQVIIGFRRLIDWMPSFHFQMFRNLNNYKRFAVEGKVMFRSGEVLHPDKILEKYIKELKDVTFIRMEYMYEDFSRFFEDRIDKEELRKVCLKKIGEKKYKKPSLLDDEIAYIYEKNPLWSSIEQKIYS